MKREASERFFLRRFCLAYKNWILLILGLVIIAYVARVDYDLTRYINQHKYKPFSDFMGQTVFEGNLPGGSDPAIFFMAFFLGAYVWVQLKSNKRLEAWRPQLGFIVLSGLTAGVELVHGLKWIIGRARPHLVWKDGLAYSDWYEFGPHFFSDGVFHGSFPSGHAAAVFAMIALAYILAGDKGQPSSRKLLGLVWGGLVLAYSLGMSIGRAMSLSHWIGDGLVTIFISWLVIHFLYYSFLKMPQQTEFYKENGCHAASPFWEMILALHLFFVVTGAIFLITGIRAIQIREHPWQIILIIPGFLLMAYFGRQAGQVYTRFRQALEPRPQELPELIREIA